MNKKGFYNGLDMIWIFLGIMLFSAPLFIVLYSSGTITIEFPQARELNQCLGELQICTEMKTPSCTPVEVKQDNSYWFFYVLGLLIYIGTLFYTYKKSKQLDEREKELNKKFTKNKTKEVK